MIALQQKYADKNFTILAFPSNDFRQETGSNEEIAAFVSSNYPNVYLPLFEKSRLSLNPVYRTLKMHPNVQGMPVKGNFNKYLVDRNGIAVSMHGKKETFFSFEDEIRELLEL